MRIRSARVADAEAIATALYETSAAQEGLLVSRPHEIPVQAFRDKIERLSDTGLYIVLDDDGVLAGHLTLEPEPFAAIRHVVELSIIVHPGYTDRGLGRRLMRHAIDWARRSPEVEKIELSMRSTNPRARRLYESLGFEVEGVLKDHVRLSDGFADDILMALFVREAGP